MLRADLATEIPQSCNDLDRILDATDSIERILGDMGMWDSSKYYTDKIFGSIEIIREYCEYVRAINEDLRNELFGVGTDADNLEKENAKLWERIDDLQSILDGNYFYSEEEEHEYRY